MRSRPPLDPATAALIRAARAPQRGSFSRRSLLAGGGLGAFAALAGCAPPEPPAGGVAQLDLPEDVSEQEKIVRWANWTAYLDYDEDSKSYPTLDAFEEKTGIKATYSEDVDDNDSYFNKIAPQLRAGQDIGRDIFTFTDWMANRIIQQQLAQPLDMVQMGNVAQNMLPSLKTVPFDPGRQFSVTWQSGFAGIGYNKKKVGRELKTLEDLWAEDLKGRITVLSEFRDTLGVIMLEQGVDINGDITTEQFQAAVDEVDRRISDGYIRRVKGNSYLEDLKSGNAIAGIVWSGDLFVLRAETEDDSWEFVIPESGGTMWSDNLMVPMTSTHKDNAETLIDYYYDPKVAAEVAAWVNYICPVEGAQKAMEKIDPDLAESPFIFPTEDYLSDNNIQFFAALEPEQDAEFSETWQRVVGN